MILTQSTLLTREGIEKKRIVFDRHQLKNYSLIYPSFHR